MIPMQKQRRNLKKWTLIRRIVQVTVLGLILSPLFISKTSSSYFFYGSLASSNLLGIQLSDPYAALQIVLASKKVSAGLIGGAFIVLAIYMLIRGRVFCSWVCPVNLVLEFTDKLRGLFKLPDVPINRHLKLYLALLFLLLSFVLGIPVFELISPVGGLMKSILFSFGIGLWLFMAIVLFELFISKRGWCRSICPLGGFYQILGRGGRFHVAFDHDRCTGCDQCRSVCFSSPEILEPGIDRETRFVIAGDCSLCGACVDHCPFNALKVVRKDKNNEKHL